MSELKSTSELLRNLRLRGWAVAVHNDYQQNRQPRTFWLLTHPSGVWAKGEGRTDEEALTVATLQTQEREEDPPWAPQIPTREAQQRAAARAEADGIDVLAAAGGAALAAYCLGEGDDGDVPELVWADGRRDAARVAVMMVLGNEVLTVPRSATQRSVFTAAVRQLNELVGVRVTPMGIETARTGANTLAVASALADRPRPVMPPVGVTMAPLTGDAVTRDGVPAAGDPWFDLKCPQCGRPAAVHQQRFGDDTARCSWRWDPAEQAFINEDQCEPPYAGTVWLEELLRAPAVTEAARRAARTLATRGVLRWLPEFRQGVDCGCDRPAVLLRLSTPGGPWITSCLACAVSDEVIKMRPLVGGSELKRTDLMVSGLLTRTTEVNGWFEPDGYDAGDREEHLASAWNGDRVQLRDLLPDGIAKRQHGRYMITVTFTPDPAATP